MTINYSIRVENPGDETAIADLHSDAFGSDEVIPTLVDRLRELVAPFPTISLVAEAGSGQVIGHVMISHSWLDTPKQMTDILVLSPLGVATSLHGNGIGTALLNRAIQEARRTTAPIMVLEGSPKFYGARGFEPSKPNGIRSPSLRIPEAALQMIKLPTYTSDMTGTLAYRELWWELDCVGLR